MPARIVEIDDAKALEWQLAENSQRVDVHPYEEAQGFQRLLDIPGYDVAALVEKSGKSASHVYARLSLLQLIPTVAEAFTQERITASHANLIARLPQESQAEAFEQCWRKDWQDKEPHLLPAKHLAAWIQTNLYLSLAEAPFDWEDPTLNPAAGACVTCPRRSGYNTALFADVVSDQCLDSSCYHSKVEAFLNREIAAIPASSRSRTAGEIFERIIEEAPASFDPAQMRVFLRLLIHLDYSFLEEVANHFANGDENAQQSDDKIVLAALDGTAVEKLTSLALRLVLSDHLGIPQENQLDLLTEAEQVFVPKKPKAVRSKGDSSSKPQPKAVKASPKKETGRKKPLRLRTHCGPGFVRCRFVSGQSAQITPEIPLRFLPDPHSARLPAAIACILSSRVMHEFFLRQHALSKIVFSPENAVVGSGSQLLPQTGR